MDITSTQTFDIPPPFSLRTHQPSEQMRGESAAATIYIPNIKTITLVTTISSNVGSITTPAIAPSSPTPVSPVVSSTSSSASASSSISTYIPTTALSFLTSHLSSPAITTSPLSSTSVVKPSIASNEPNQIGLSTSAKIGVAVGAVLGGFAIGLTAFCLGLRLHRRRKSAFDGDMTPVYGGNPEKDGNEVFRSEMNGTPMVQQTVAELETPTHDLIMMQQMMKQISELTARIAKIETTSTPTPAEPTPTPAVDATPPPAMPAPPHEPKGLKDPDAFDGTRSQYLL
ncbi:hypothetical protein A1F94_010159 [Pyrenophora tritici-repentis]|nr:hypothetical protein A1F94_010159 [Pyrenophora tritici-repentis]